MMQSRAPDSSNAVGFWKFIIVTTVVIVLLRGGPGFAGKVMSTVPFSIFGWILYRVARLQIWWPFHPEFSLSSRIEALKKPLDAEALKNLGRQHMARQAELARQKVNVPKQKKVAAKVSSRVEVASHAVSQAAVIRTAEPAAFKVLTQAMSSVGARTKTVRSKTSRSKAVRSKRPPGFL